MTNTPIPVTPAALGAARPPAGTLRGLAEKGLFSQCTNAEGLAAAFAAGVTPVYAGFDLTADSLHVGHLLPIMGLRHLQRAGHKPIVLLGGGTTRIGDPSFRSDSRPMLTDEQIAVNKAGIQKVFERFLVFGDGPTDAVMVDNADWFDKLGFVEMLRLVGPHFSINRMLSFDSVKNRLERQDSMSFLEFNYMILQAFDFLELSRREGCVVELGGSDQWGNIVNGVDLVRRIDGKEVFGLTLPLLTTSSGAKMGKTAAGAVWLNADRLSPNDYWQFWRGTEDGDVLRFLRLFTDLPAEQIASLEGLAGVALNGLKERLATEATTLAHGAEAAARAAAKAARVFGGAEGAPEPEVLLQLAQVEQGLSVASALQAAGLAVSKGEARRVIAGKGVRLNGSVVESEQAQLGPDDFGQGRTATLSVGKKRHVVFGLAVA